MYYHTTVGRTWNLQNLHFLGGMLHFVLYTYDVLFQLFLWDCWSVEPDILLSHMREGMLYLFYVPQTI